MNQSKDVSYWNKFKFSFVLKPIFYTDERGPWRIEGMTTILVISRVVQSLGGWFQMVYGKSLGSEHSKTFQELVFNYMYGNRKSLFTTLGHSGGQFFSMG